MSKSVKTIASIALPIIGTIVGGPIGGMIGGAIGGGIAGGAPGALMGGAGGYFGSGAVSGLIGSSAGTPLAGLAGNSALMQGPSMGSGILGMLTGGGTKALGAGIGSAGMGGSSAFNPLQLLTGTGNPLMSMSNAGASDKAVKFQQAYLNQALAQQAPYQQLGTDAIAKIQAIQADPAGYIKNNPMYATLAEDAKNKLLANEAAKGKVGSGGTAAALQNQLMMLGNSLMNQELNNLSGQTQIGQKSAFGASGLYSDKGDVTASGIMGKNNTMQSGYQNQLNTLLALQGMSNNPAYSPSPMQYF